MGSILSALFGSSEPEQPAFESPTQDYNFQEDTTKLVGVPLTVIYGDRVHLRGNVVHRKLSTNRKNIEEAVAMCWGPVTFFPDSIRVNEKRPEYINGVLNANKDTDPGFISGVKVTTHSGTNGQTPAHDLEYGMNRTAYLWVEAVANSDLSSINQVAVDAARGDLFKTGSGYSTPIPSQIAAAYPSGISSTNPIAAGLDYMLNTEYGAGRNPTAFKDFASWLSAMTYCDETLAIDTAPFVWDAAINAVKSGNTISKTVADYAWSSGALSVTPISLNGGYVEFVAGAPVSTSIPYDYYDAEGAHFSGSTAHYENVICGLSSKKPSTHTLAGINFGFSLHGDGNAYIIDSGAEKSDPIPYSAGTRFGIELDEYGIATYYVDDVLNVYIATRSSFLPQYADICLWAEGASVTVGKWEEGPTSENRYGICLEAGDTDGDTHADVLQKILNVANATPFDANGATKLWIARPATIVANFDQTNFIPDSASTVDIMDIPNVVSVEYRIASDAGDKREVVWEDVESISNWQEIRNDKQIFGIQSRTQASRTVRYLGRRAKSERLKISGICDQRFFNLEPGDLVGVTYGAIDATWFVDKKFWVDSIVPDNKDGDVEVQLVEYGGDSLFDDGMTNVFDRNDPLSAPDPTLRLPDPKQKPLLANDVVAVAGVLDRKPTKIFFVDVSWTSPTQPDYMHQDWVIYRKRSDIVELWQAINSVSGHSLAYRDLSAEPHKYSYDYVIAARTSSGVESDLPTGGGGHVVSLSIDLPSAISGLSATLMADSRVDVGWSYSNPPIDFDAFDVFVTPGAVADTAGLSLLGGVTTKGTKSWAAATPGTYTVSVQSRDTFGNHSATMSVPFLMPEVPSIKWLFSDFYSTTGRRFTWNMDGERGINFAGFQVRYNTTGQNKWDQATPIHEGMIQTTEFLATSLPPGRLGILVRAFDTFGNASPLPALLVLNIDNIQPENIIQTVDHHATGFLGTKTNGSVEGGSGDLVADDTTGLFFYHLDTDPIFFDDTALMYGIDYKVMVYTTPIYSPTENGRAIFDVTTESSSYSMEYRVPYPLPLCPSLDTDLMFTKGDTDYFYDLGDFQVWPGSVDMTAGTDYEWRLTTDAPAPQGRVTALSMHQDVPDSEETKNDIVIAPGGTRLPITAGLHREIRSVNLTLQYDGGTAVTVKVIDKNAITGPLIRAYDSSGTSVSATVDAIIRGVLKK